MHLRLNYRVLQGNLLTKCHTNPNARNPVKVHAKSFCSRSSDIGSIIRKLRSPSTDEVLSVSDLNKVLNVLSELPKKRETGEVVIRRFRQMCPSMSLEESLSIMDKLYMMSSLRSYPKIVEEMRGVMHDLSLKGPSSFSLDSFEHFMDLCHRIRVEVDKSFIDTMCERIAAIDVGDSVQDQCELASYIVRVNRLVPNPHLTDRIRKFDSPCLQRLSLCDLQSILTAFPNESDDFIATVRKAAVIALKSRTVTDILTDLVSNKLGVSDDIFKAGVAMCDSKIEPLTLSPKDASLLLRVWGKQRSVSSKLAVDNSVIQSIIVQAFNEETEIVRNLHSLSRLDFLSEIPQDIVMNAVIENSAMTTDEEDDANLPSIVESVALLRLNSPELIGSLLSRIEAYICNCPEKDSSQFWKFSVWWFRVRYSLRYDSMLVDVLMKEFPETVRLLTHSPSDEFIQQVRPRTWYAKTIESVASYLRNNRVDFTVLPRIEHTPIRAHFCVRIGSEKCYVVLLNGEVDLIQVSSDSRLTVGLIKEFANYNKHKIAFVPVEHLTEPSLLNPLKVISQYIASS